MNVVAELLAVLTPPLCVVCRVPTAAGGSMLCPVCVRSMPWLPERRCASCGLVQHRGDTCPARDAAFACAWSPVAYDGVARGLVRALKYDGTLAAARLMAAQIATNAPSWLLGGDVRSAVLVPVPTVRMRTRRRGFDPAALLARELATRTGLTVDACLRRRGRARQVGAGRRQRRDSARLRVELSGEAPAGLVVLVDDVHTTGATLQACAAALRAAGTPRVHAVTYARTQ